MAIKTMPAPSLALVLGCSVFTACAQAPQSPAPFTAPDTADASANAAVDAAATATTAPTSPWPTVVVHKHASCGCCHLWVEHMREAGFQVEVRDVGNLAPVKERVGVPAGMGSCHTAEVGGYFIEGHVPAADVARLLAERPDALGLAVPGMPLGSPGMEVPDGRTQPYDVVLVTGAGPEVFARHGEPASAPGG